MFAPVRVLTRRAPASTAAFSTAAVRLAPPKKAAKGPVGVYSLKAGQIMHGLSVLKDKPDPVALNDDEYPAWLYRILEDKPAAAAEGEFDFAAERKKLRKENRSSIRAANFMKTT